MTSEKYDLVLEKLSRNKKLGVGKKKFIHMVPVELQLAD